MKKKITLALVTVLMMACIFTLSACGTPCDITTTEELAEYFDKIYNTDNFTGRILGIRENSISSKIEIKKDGNKARIIAYDTIKNETPFYVEMNPEKHYSYAYIQTSNGIWQKLSVPYSSAESASDILFQLDTILSPKIVASLLNADNYSYSEEEGCFIHNEQDLPENAIAITLTVKNRKVKIRIVPELEDINESYKIEFFGFGTASVYIPNVE